MLIRRVYIAVSVDKDTILYNQIDLRHAQRNPKKSICINKLAIAK